MQIQGIRVKKRILVPAFLVVAMLGMVCRSYIRGSWADSQWLVPASAADGVHSQIYRTDQGRIVNRAAVVVTSPITRVRELITDSKRFGNLLPGIGELEIKSTGETNRIEGTWVTPWATVPLSVSVYQKDEGRTFTLGWEGTQAPFKANRGAWTLERIDEATTRVCAKADIGFFWYPDFLVRNFLLDHLLETLLNLRESLSTTPPGRSKE